ncbi:precorrin-6x reductase CbiJ/CobK family protein [Burkholderia pseudomallei]|nr:precorrin-6x reductase CbiJ/CobK family protein [Burkholderia pseudomallei]
MRRVLLLGGTGDALRTARALAPHDVYSLAGLGRVPDDLACGVRVGGFGGADGLARYLREHAVALVVDATHPFAARISANAAAACRAAGVPYWALRRAPWRPRPGDDWRGVADWAGVLAAIAPFARPLFTLGREPLAHLDEIAPHQHWLVRCLDAHAGNARARTCSPRAGRFRSKASARCSRRRRSTSSSARTAAGRRRRRNSTSRASGACRS